MAPMSGIACHAFCPVQYSVQGTFQPDPQTSFIAEKSVTIAGTPQAWASMIGSPKPSPRAGFSRTSKAL